MKKIILVLFISVLISAPFFLKVKVKGRNIHSGSLFIVTKELKKNLKDDPNVTDYSIRFELPNTLLVTTTLKKPIVAIYNVNSKRYILLDNKNNTLSVADNTNLPFIIQQDDSINLYTLNLIKLISSKFSVSHAEIKGDTMLVDMPSGVRVIFPIDGDYVTNFSGMELIYNKIMSDYNGRFKEIDMRFVNPILR